MAEIDTDLGFRSQICRQEIFKTLTNEVSTQEEFQNKLVCVNNTDVYMAVNNFVRYTSIDRSGSYYKILDTGKDCNFTIRTLQVNPLGTLIALVGNEEICVISTVSGIHNSAVLKVKTHKLQNTGKIIKTCWQSACSNDCTLVILNDRNQIQSYDLLISLVSPVLSIDLNEQDEFKSQTATSITFGSKVNLIGSLTLYVSTSEGTIYAIYPYVSEYAKLATTIDQIDDAINESSLIIKTIEEKFPFTDIYDSLNSKLKMKALVQYEYFLDLKKKANSGIPITTEVRNIGTTKPYELLVFEQLFPHDATPIVQGPLNQSEGCRIVDLSDYSSNSVVSVLISVSSDVKTSLLGSYCQLSPLIMNWKGTDEDHFTPTHIKKDPPKSKKHGYVKPKKGFGFLDISDVEDDVKETAEQRTDRLRIERSQEESIFWQQEFKQLSTLGLDSISSSCTPKTRVILLGAKDQKLALNLDNKLIVFESKWVDGLVKSIKSNARDPEFDITNSYVNVSGDFDKLGGVMFLSKESETADYLVSHTSKETDNLSVVQLEVKENREIPRLKITIEPELPKDTGTRLQKDNTIEMIVQEVKRAQENLKPRANQPLQANANSLQQVNEVSTEVLNKVLIYTTNTLKLLFRLQSQVAEMERQLGVILSITDLSVDSERLEESQLRLDALYIRQEQADKKVEDIKTNLTKYLQNLSQNKSLPLSKAERAWFKEINDINDQVNGSSASDQSLITKVKAAETQVNALKKDINQSSTTETPAQQLKLMELRQLVSKLQYNLQEKGELIDSAKAKLEENFKKLAIK